MSVPRVRCPTCQREVSWTPEFPFRPFCSERCKMVDLGAWFAEERAVPGDAVDPTAPAEDDR
ncbi:MAG: DNA gyrase inhibitor YacG [Steroidobacteraceae bacterium]